MAARLSKPLPSLSTSVDLTAPTSQATIQREAARSKRKERHEAKESQRPHDKKLMNNPAIDERARKLYTLSWVTQMQHAVRRFAEFTEEKLGLPPGHPQHGMEYFKPGGPVPNEPLVRRFLFWYADSSTGKVASNSRKPSVSIQNNNVTVVTVKVFCHALFTAAAYYNTSMPRELKRDTEVWLAITLASELDLVQNQGPKPTVRPTDVEVAIRAMWDYRSVAAIRTFRARFLATLILNLLVDGAGHVGEMLPCTLKNADDGKFLKWEDIEIFASPSSDGGSIPEIRINVTFKWLKNHTFDPKEWKTIVLRLLPPHLVFQDSCRLLILLALMDRRLAHFGSWEQLASCRPNPNGSVILLNDSDLQKPVFSKAALTGRIEDELRPWKWRNLGDLMSHISRLAGFPEKFKLHAMRRGATFLLDTHVSPETARALMGHQRDSNAFREYMSKTSTTDYQAITKRLPTTDITQMSSISLGQVEGAPHGPSPAAFAALESDLEYKLHTEALESARAVWRSCMEEYGSGKQALAACPEARSAYQKVTNARRYYAPAFLEQRYREEYEKYCITASTLLPEPLPESTASNSPQEVDSRASTPPTAEPEADVGARPEDLDPEEEAALILQEFGRLSEEQTATLTAALTDSRNPGVGSNVSLDHAVEAATSLQHRLHGVVREDLNRMVGHTGRTFTQLQCFSPRAMFLADIYDALSQDESLSAADVTETIFSLMTSEVFPHVVPPHW
ncbi:hypothetical protein H2201_001119 [Coniosporium apollinis]|uniref:Tyr recombinase domain-containing protein n=2 Tax=Coniosporium TaxID=2810619 RepID=A0ABQ9P7L5_9PEZI|nr:hypothetical protein H2199_003090 [Cladosporium sp. JES 115]KAJ9668873.1 hypothetical protein H2201_001119 [Coniosporium apollinis]